MRLTVGQVHIIKQTVQDSFGLDAQVRLFGSRIDDAANGGDVDLHVTLRQPVGVWAVAQLASRLERGLHGRKVDVRVWAEGQPLLPIDHVALARGVVL
ncbi:MAG TPA: nucleotidyltransferase domain-containing protein [Burkholderiaceae bacterium]|nr:nucleotidyltransferase domain-containing protein [Burkholderiaceae bacterium]